MRGRELRVVERPGDGAAPPLLLLNGIGSSLELLDPFVDALDPDRGVIRFDVPGIGGSAKPLVPYHMTTFAPLVAKLLDRLGHDRVDVLGISWGGGLAQQLALQCRSRCRRLVLVATGTGSLMVPARPRVLARMVSARRHRDPGYAARVAGSIYGGTMRSHPERAVDLLHTGRSETSLRGYLYQLVAGSWWTTLPVLPALRQPTLILAGDDDPIIPVVNAKIMKRLLPDARLHLYRGGHLALVTEAGELAPLVEAFLDERD
ncbi:poly(3-hydroxyalkanoate) depolymerase [Actinomycetospora sp. C-140]